MAEPRGGAYYEELVESAPDAILVVDRQGTIELVNGQAEVLFGYPRAELIGQPVEVLVPDRARDVHPSHRVGYFGDPRTRPMGAGLDLTARRKDGNEVPVDISLSPLRTDRGMVVAVAIRDVTERKRAEKALQEAYERLSASVAELERHDRDMTLVNEMGDLLQSCLTTHEAHQVISRFARRLFPGDSGAVFIAAGSSDVLEAAVTWGALVSRATVIEREQCWALRRGRAYIVDGRDDGPLCSHLDVVPAAGSICVPMLAQGEPFGVLSVVLADGEGDGGPALFDSKRRLALTVAEQLSLALANLGLRESLRHQSVSDSLTGLFNRRYMEKELSRQIARGRSAGKPVGVIIADVDRFKEVNDKLGHAMGDDVLRSVARVFEDAVRGADVVCRYGGDELVIVMPGSELDVVRQRAEQLRQAVSRLHGGDDSRPRVTISLGVAVFPDNGDNAQTLLHAADVALYRAKDAGRNTVAVP